MAASEAPRNSDPLDLTNIPLTDLDTIDKINRFLKDIIDNITNPPIKNSELEVFLGQLSLPSIRNSKLEDLFLGGLQDDNFKQNSGLKNYKMYLNSGGGHNDCLIISFLDSISPYFRKYKDREAFAKNFRTQYLSRLVSEETNKIILPDAKKKIIFTELKTSAYLGDDTMGFLSRKYKIGILSIETKKYKGTLVENPHTIELGIEKVILKENSAMMAISLSPDKPYDTGIIIFNIDNGHYESVFDTTKRFPNETIFKNKDLKALKKSIDEASPFEDYRLITRAPVIDVGTEVDIYDPSTDTWSNGGWYVSYKLHDGVFGQLWHYVVVTNNAIGELKISLTSKDHLQQALSQGNPNKITKKLVLDSILSESGIEVRAYLNIFTKKPEEIIDVIEKNNVRSHVGAAESPGAAAKSALTIPGAASYTPLIGSKISPVSRSLKEDILLKLKCPGIPDEGKNEWKIKSVNKDIFKASFVKARDFIKSDTNIQSIIDYIIDLIKQELIRLIAIQLASSGTLNEDYFTRLNNHIKKIIPTLEDGILWKTYNSFAGGNRSITYKHTKKKSKKSKKKLKTKKKLKLKSKLKTRSKGKGSRPKY